MGIPVIIDIIAAAVLLGFTVYGARRGLFRALAGLLIVAAALIGARMAAETLVPPVMDLSRPLIQRHVEKELDQALGDQVEVSMPEEPEALLALLGVDEARLAELAEQVRRTIQETGATILAAVAESLAEPVLYSLLFLLAFLLLTAALRLAARLLDLALKLPVLHGANALGGVAVGLLEGLVVLAVAALVLKRLDVPLAESHLLRIFAAWLP
nr:CvpA family protein [uncultured Dysosmobacter sp.]